MSRLVYGVLIQTDGRGFRPVVGWDAAFGSRADAEACAVRARKQDGWDAKVIEMTPDEAQANGWGEP